MKLHETLVEVLVSTYEVNSGWTEERKLKEALRRLDVSVYTQTNGTQVLVSTEQLQEHLRAFEQARAQQAELEAQNRGR